MGARLGWALVFLTGLALAQEGPHWGTQGDAGFFVLPSFIVEEIHTLPEVPSIDGLAFQVGVVRFNGRGAPSYAFQYSEIRVDIEGSVADARGSGSVSGSGTMRGFMATKYFNFITADRISAGLALGGGVGNLDAFYTRTVSSLTATVFSETRRYSYTVPFFELLARVDFRIAKYVTVGPYYGIRNGALGGGGCIRVHFLK